MKVKVRTIRNVCLALLGTGALFAFLVTTGLVPAGVILFAVMVAAVLGFGVVVQLQLQKSSNLCSFGSCYKLGGYEYEGMRLCNGHYIMRKYDPYLEYVFA